MSDISFLSAANLDFVKNFFPGLASGNKPFCISLMREFELGVSFPSDLEPNETYFFILIRESLGAILRYPLVTEPEEDPLLLE